jgi:hypothetical protein
MPIVESFDQALTNSERKFSMLTRRMIAGFSLVDQRSYQAGPLAADREGLYKSPAKPRMKG